MVFNFNEKKKYASNIFSKWKKKQGFCGSIHRKSSQLTNTVSYDFLQTRHDSFKQTSKFPYKKHSNSHAICTVATPNNTK